MKEKSEVNNTITVDATHGDLMVWKCPVCDTNTKEVGDLSNPCAIVMGEKFCESCKEKIRQLILKQL